MKRNYFLAAVASLCTLLTACTSHIETKPADTTTRAESNVITFAVNGETVNTTGWNISRFDAGAGLNLNITTNMHQDKRTVMLNLRGCIPGTYSLTDDASGELSGYGSYKPDYSDLLNAYKFVKGTFTITGIDTAKGILNAAFSGTVRKGSESFQITGGRIINGTLNKMVQRY
jgi:hypothetical protein